MRAARARRPARGIPALLLALLAALYLNLACAQEAPLYMHNRFDYWAFRGRVGRLYEPNYLPWITHQERLPDGRRALVVCRWADEAFPLAYHVQAPVIPRNVQDEFHPADPQDFVAAIDRALALWSKSIGEPVRFRRVDDPSRADLRLHLHARAYETGDVRVLGLVRDQAGQCRVTGEGDTIDRVRTVFSVPDVHLYIVDPVGLLTPNQVYTVALHEIGHVLGASGQHSPLRGDVMYQVADDGRVDVLSEHDLNTLRSLYRLPPGSIYARIDEAHAEPLREVRRSPPRLDRRVTDERRDFAVSFPKGWQIIRSSRGWVGVDGVSWDYDSSIQTLTLRGRMEDFFQQRKRAFRLRGELIEARVLEIDGERVGRLVSKRHGRVEEMWFQDWSADSIFLMIADCPERDHDFYRSWFQLVFLSLDRAG